MMDELKQHLKINELYDLYGGLLTERQQDAIVRYYSDNYSLAEIAELNGTSRNAVHETLKHAIGKLQDYESTLLLLEKRHRQRVLIAQLRELELPIAAKTILDELEKVV